eukprot:m.46313 g.46313  ORF g.46313 m.46313 type:complete len:64 (+) comp10915_c0_seq1:56-247(+)
MLCMLFEVALSDFDEYYLFSFSCHVLSVVRTAHVSVKAALAPIPCARTHNMTSAGLNIPQQQT